MIKFLDLQRQYESLKPDIDAAIQGIVANSAFIGGSAVKEFERSFADYQHAEYCVGVANGTDALEIAIEALDLPVGSEIIVPANSFIASSESVTRSGHRVVFADIEADTFLLDLNDVERRITSSTSAIMAVHLYGQPCDMEAILTMASAHGLKVIEDAAQAHGAEIEGRRIGAFGDIGTFSFYPGKNLGAYGDAGAIVTNDALLEKRCRMIANHGRIDKYDHEFEGRNSRLDGLQAAVLSTKLKHLDEWITSRNEVARLYASELCGASSVRLPVIRDGVRHSFHLYVIRSNARDDLVEFLAEREIQTGIHYPVALPRLRAYEYTGQGREDMIANRQDATLLSLPMGEHLRPEDVIEVASAIKSFHA